MKRVYRILSLILAVCIIGGSCLTGSFAQAEEKADVKTDNMKIGTNFWFRASWSGEEPMKPGVDFATAYESGENVWSQVFLDELEPYKFLRFMDWGLTNNSPVVEWSKRRQVTDPNNNDVSSGESGGMAYEWMIDLCNRAKKDLWLCVPHQANDDYILNLAKLVKEKLNPELHCYIEYSNETWNSQFQQHQYCAAKGEELGMPGSDSAYKAEAYNMYRSLQIFDIFDEVFGEDTQKRITKVCSISNTYQWFSTSYINIFLNPKYNPNWQKPDVMAIAPYVGGGLKGSDPEIATKFRAETDKVYEQMLVAKNIADQFGLRLGTYEGGQHLLDGADVFSKNPAIYDEYMYMLDKFAPLLEFFGHYGHCGTPASGGAWGAKFYTGQPIEEAHRYRALYDWTHKNPSTTNFIISEHNNPKEVELDFNYIKSSNKSVSGYATENTDVTLYIGSEAIGTVRADDYGNFEFKNLNFTKYKNLSKVKFVSSYIKYGKTYSSEKVLELVKVPKDVKLNTKKISRKTKVIKGTTTAKANVKIVVKNKTVKKLKANAKGKFSAKVNLSKYKAKSKVKVYAYVLYNKKEVKSKVVTVKLAKK